MWISSKGQSNSQEELMAIPALRPEALIVGDGELGRRDVWGNSIARGGETTRCPSKTAKKERKRNNRSMIWEAPAKRQDMGSACYR